MGSVCCVDDKSAMGQVSAMPTHNVELLEDPPFTTQPAEEAKRPAEGTTEVEAAGAEEAVKAAEEEAAKKEAAKRKAEEVANREAEEAAKKTEEATPATECEFNITLKKLDTSAKWGFGIRCFKEQTCIREVRGPAMDEWHANNPTKKVRSGDEIVSMNGSSGDYKSLMQVMKNNGELNVVLRRQLEFSITGKRPLGLVFVTGSVEVKEVTNGSVKDYNDACFPSVEVTPGDILVGVNEVKTNLVEELEKNNVSDQIKLTFQRPNVA